MKTWNTNCVPFEPYGEFARRCGAMIVRALQAAIRLWATFALDAAERHLHNLDDCTLRDLGFDPRDLPIRDQMARRSGASLVSNVSAAMDYMQ